MKFIRIALLLCALVSVSTRADTGITDTTIKVGQSVSLSGTNADLGIAYTTGIKAYFHVINSQHGVNGRKIELVTLDDGYEPTRTIANTQNLIDKEGVFALVGYVGTAPSEAAMSIVSTQHVPLFAPLSGASSLREPYQRYVINVRAGYYRETEKAIELLGSGGSASVGVIYQNDGFGKAVLTGIEKAMSKYNTKPVVTATIERNSMLVEPAVKALLEKAPTSVFVVGVAGPVAEAIKQYKEVYPNTRFFTVSFTNAEKLAELLGEKGRGVIVSEVMPPPKTDLSPSGKLYRQQVGEFATSYATYEGWIVAMAFVRALELAGKNPTREGFINALDSAGPIDLGEFTLHCTKNSHNCSDYTDLTMVTWSQHLTR